MTTELKRFTEAYATMTVAAYEPLLLRWISQSCIRFLSNEVAYRLPKARAVKYDGKAPAALALSKTIREPIPLNSKLRFHDDAEMRVPIDIHGRPIHTSNVKKVVLSGYPNAVAIGNDVYLNGITTTDPEQLFVETKGCCMPGESAAARILSNVSSRLGMVAQRIKTIPLTISSRLGRQQPGFDFTLARDTVEKNLIQAVQDWVKDPNGKDEDLVKLMIRATNVDGVQLPHLWPSKYEGLSPIGIAHYFRQLYFNKEEGVGPIEEAFTVAPLETLEVIYQTVRKQSHEEILEQGLEVVSEAAVEEKNLDEVSDKVSSMVQQDISASMSANASGSIGVWQVGASASANIGVSSQRSREYSTRRLKEVTKRASERITKSFSIKVKDTTEVTETTTTRRVIRNESASPVSYGLRRVLRRVNVKVQDLGPRLVWQVYLRNPGNGLARSRFVHFHESGPITAPDIPPGTPPRPSGGTETGSVSANLKVDQSLRINFVTIVVRPGADRVVTGLRIDSITDLDGGGKNDRAPAARNDFDLGSTWDPTTHTFTANIGVWMGNSMSLQVSYTYTWEPSDSVLEDWETQRAAAVAKFTEEAMTKKFERDKALITEKSKVKSRPASDLRREERYEMMNRMVNYLFGRGDDPSEPTPLEIEFFHRYFDIDAIFTYNHPSWWKPRFASNTMGLDRDPYEITDESEPAPLGSSLGWLIQLDGDSRRNEFLNSPWCRMCVPIRAGREREALQWLAVHVEGELGYNIDAGQLATLVEEIEKYRDQEGKLGLNGADYVTVDSTPGAPADPAKPEGVYPIVDQFDVTMPTDGFVFDELKVTIP